MDYSNSYLYILCKNHCLLNYLTKQILCLEYLQNLGEKNSLKKNK